MNLRDTAAAWQPQAQALLRIVVGYLFLSHGAAKLLGVPHVAMFDNLQVFSLIGVAGILELVGGTLFLVGLCTRVVAFVLSGEMAVAYFMGHASKGHALVPSLNGGELAVVYCFVFLFFAAAGAGAWSVDSAWRRPRP
jgi:putative oxidoreductase